MAVGSLLKFHSMGGKPRIISRIGRLASSATRRVGISYSGSPNVHVFFRELYRGRTTDTDVPFCQEDPDRSAFPHIGRCLVIRSRRTPSRLFGELCAAASARKCCLLPPTPSARDCIRGGKLRTAQAVLHAPSG